MKELLIAVAVTVMQGVSVATASPLLNFDFSFTSTSPNVPGTVTGEIFGLMDNQSSTAAQDVKIFSYPSGLGLSLVTPFDIFTDPSTTILSNTFQTSGGHIISEDFDAVGFSPERSNRYNFSLASPTGSLQNPGPPILTAMGTPSFNQVPLPAALPLFATGLGALGLLGWRRKRKAQAVA
jgi:hypothetical protein